MIRRLLARLSALVVADPETGERLAEADREATAQARTALAESAQPHPSHWTPDGAGLAYAEAVTRRVQGSGHRVLDCRCSSCRTAVDAVAARLARASDEDRAWLDEIGVSL